MNKQAHASLLQFNEGINLFIKCCIFVTFVCVYSSSLCYVGHQPAMHDLAHISCLLAGGWAVALL